MLGACKRVCTLLGFHALKSTSINLKLFVLLSMTERALDRAAPVRPSGTADPARSSSFASRTHEQGGMAPHVNLAAYYKLEGGGGAYAAL